jgi:gluconolactonase
MKVDINEIFTARDPEEFSFSPEQHLGTIKPAEVPANCHWGESDAKTLYMTARTGFYRIRLSLPGIRP